MITRFEKSFLADAHLHASDHRGEVEASRLCGCFFCQETFEAGEIEQWVDQGGVTAICPRCGFDAVLGDASGLPIKVPDFLREMNFVWFQRSLRPPNSTLGIWGFLSSLSSRSRARA